ncbi:WXG100 family type VII secretion target [Streptomyces sp. NPDC060031]|uniref:WXG100 family type VII secretion target n=1 Tax=Streptomyces sp. NPDC060031 TaxID=3347043 RepID=UPI0036CEE126
MAGNTSDGYIHVDYSSMTNSADDMVQQTKAIAATIASLDQELNTLKTTWSGADAAAYVGKQQTWDAAVKALEEMLTSHAGLLGQISDSYKYTENSLQQMWSSVKIG